MKNGFDIRIIDNFLEESKLKYFKEKLPLLPYTGLGNYLDSNPSGHVWFSCDAEDEDKIYLNNKVNKFINKKLKLEMCSYTLVSKTKPLPHSDLCKENEFQGIVYVKGNEELNKGTGFYIKNNDNYELNTHIGFKENRAIFWKANAWHAPLNWAAKNSMKRYSIIMQFTGYDE